MAQPADYKCSGSKVKGQGHRVKVQRWHVCWMARRRSVADWLCIWGLPCVQFFWGLHLPTPSPSASSLVLVVLVDTFILSFSVSLCCNGILAITQVWCSCSSSSVVCVLISYFLRLAKEFEAQMQIYRQQILEMEHHLASADQSSALSPQGRSWSPSLSSVLHAVRKYWLVLN